MTRAKKDLELKDDDYILVDESAWFTVGKFAVRVWQDGDDMLKCSIYQDGRELEEPLAECIAYSDQLKATRRRRK